jgi:hypothetical protein
MERSNGAEDMTTPIDTARIRRLLTSLAALPVVGRHLVEGQLLDALPGLLGENDRLRTLLADANEARLNDLDKVIAERDALVAARDVCVVCGNVLLPTEPHCEDCDTDGPRYTDPE